MVKSMDREVNYTLIVTLSTPASNIDLYTPNRSSIKINNKVIVD